MDLNSTVPINYTFFEVCLHSWYKIHFMEGDEIVLNVVGVIWYLGATVQVQLKLIAWEPII